MNIVEAGGARPFGTLFRGRPEWLWTANLAAWFAILVWMLLDPQFVAVVYRLGLATGYLVTNQLPLDIDNAAQLGTPKICLLFVLAALGMSSILLLGVGAFAGPKRFRSLKSWLALITLIGLWLAGLVNWSDVCWIGKQYRLRTQIAGFEPIADDLRAGWPEQDGQRAGIGPFMAYPVGRPAILLLLTLPNVSNSGTSFAAVERSARGALHFQLAGRERGDWLEWHPAGDVPRSFVGGLRERHELERHKNLGDGWYLVRYRH